ncbi:DC-STAMP domain-containing protein 2-like [Anopheles aquasalis]|uniref:DC-STAMP domain-containing protein 2-like n=1 Tax=Anopheles aquasalis TaxID=42839 RepID=UPI00215AF470|nr:DC-STAMP domain-containing protein 2-like [Anopheles aquasalis]
MSRRTTAEIFGLALVQTVIVDVFVFRQISSANTILWLLRGCWLVIAYFWLARRKSARCVTVLIVPQFLSKRGRAALIGFIFVLTVTGPTANTMRNVEVLGQTLSCTQQQLKDAIRETLHALKVPFQAMKQVIDSTLKTVERSFMKVQQQLMEILKLTKRILYSIKAAYDWLRDLVTICNDELGSPSERCVKSLDKTIAGCKEEMGAMDFLCEVTQVAKSICFGARMVDMFCELIDFVSDSIVEEIERGIQNLMQYMEELFRVQVDYDHAYDFETNASKSFAEISADIRGEIEQRTLPLRRTFSVLGVVSSGFFICIVCRAIRYRQHYLKKDTFDNRFLTEDFYEIEQRRAEMNIGVVLPLTRKERQRYVPITSPHLTWKERLRIARSITFLLISTIQILCQLFADYALYWLLTLIKTFMHEGSASVKNGSNSSVPIGVDIRGEGILADTLRDIVHSFDPIVNGSIIDPSHCVPDASPPRLGRYGEIVALLVLCWIFTIVEPYGLRARQLIMRSYYPARARARALWLHSDVLMKRENLLQIFRRYVDPPSSISRPKGTVLEVLRAKTNRIWICRKMLGTGDVPHCTLCGEMLVEQEDQLIPCSRRECPGVYCQDCFLETANSCSLCLGVLLHESNTSVISLERASLEYSQAMLSAQGYDSLSHR